MPRGIPNKPANEPAPMIFVEPAGDGAIRINAYGLDAGQIIDTLRRTLLHLVATESGVQVISLDVPPAAAAIPAVRSTRAKAKPKPAKPSRNGSKPAPGGSRVLVADDVADEEDFDLFGEDDQ